MGLLLAIQKLYFMEEMDMVLAAAVVPVRKTMANRGKSNLAVRY